MFPNDKNQKFSEGQAVAGASTQSTTTVDIGHPRDIAIGSQRIQVLVEVSKTATTAHAVTVKLETSDKSDFSSGVSTITLGATTADVEQGVRIRRNLSPGDWTKQYGRLKYESNAALAGAEFTAQVVAEAPEQVYPSKRLQG